MNVVKSALKSDIVNVAGTDLNMRSCTTGIKKRENNYKQPFLELKLITSKCTEAHSDTWGGPYKPVIDQG